MNRESSLDLLDIGIIIILLASTISLGIISIALASSLDELKQEKRNHENFKSCIIHNQKNILACEYLGVQFNKLKGE